MSASVIVQLTAIEGKAELLKEFLRGVQKGAIAAGCQRITLCQVDENPNIFIEYEEWESIEAHKTFMANLPSEVMLPLKTLLAGRANITYYHRIQTTEH